MLEKLKSYFNYIFGGLVIILGALLFNRNRKLQQTESELAKAVADKEISTNEQARQDARATADDLVSAYEKLKRGE
jgi:hypothetical protein